MNRRQAAGNVDDTALVLAAQGGDKGAFATLLERYWPMVFALCLRMLGDPAVAEDAAQEAALQGFLCLDSLRRGDRFGPWLGGIGLNVCRQWLRARSYDYWSWEALQGGLVVRDLVEPGSGPEELAEAADLRERVQRAVAELPLGQRAAVLLFYLSGMTHAEVAAHLGIEVGAVKTRLHKARAALRRQLWAEWKEEAMATAAGTQAVEMRVVDVRRRSATEDQPGEHVIVLKEVDGTRQLFIWVGPFECEAMALELEKVEYSRPLTFTFMANLIRATGATLREVRITKLEKTVIYASAIVEGSEGTRTVDARPSDALTLAVITGTPIRVEPAVLDAAAQVTADRSSSVEQMEVASQIAATITARCQK
jgi:RNA polymerase sigma factor (sigma-70 family)